MHTEQVDFFPQERNVYNLKSIQCNILCVACRQNNMHVLISETCEYVSLYGKNELGLLMELHSLISLSWDEDTILIHLRGPKVITTSVWWERDANESIAMLRNMRNAWLPIDIFWMGGTRQGIQKNHRIMQDMDSPKEPL